jgi:hypothetical protein
MKVKELIKRLEQEDQELEVVVQEEMYGEWEWYSVDIVEHKKDIKYEHEYIKNKGLFTIADVIQLT